MDDKKRLEELEFHQETVGADANSPLHLIREKEMEIHGRVLAAKQEAEEMVAAARKHAVEITQKAESDGAEQAKVRAAELLVAVDKDIDSVKASSVGEVETLESSIGDRTQEAVAFVVEAVKQV